MKNLIVIGNKQETPEYKGREIPLDLYIQRIDSMDFVCRVNRMMNYGTTTGTKVDGLYIGGWIDFVDYYHGGEHVDIMKTIPQIFLYNRCWEVFFKYRWNEFITQEQVDNAVWCDFDLGKERMEYEFPTSTISMIDFFCNEKPWCEDYKIWFTGLDVDNRGEIMRNGEPWKYNMHRDGGDKEEEVLRKLMKEGKLNWLDEDICEHL